MRYKSVSNHISLRATHNKRSVAPENNKIKINRTQDKCHKLISSVFLLVRTKIGASLFHVRRWSDIKTIIYSWILVSAPSTGRDESNILLPKKKCVYDLWSTNIAFSN